MNPIDWFESHSGAFTALSAIASAFFAWSIFRVERGRDLPANQVHGWVSGHGSSIYVDLNMPRREAFRLQINLINDSKLPIHDVKIQIRSISKFADSEFSLQTKKVIYKLQENIVLGELDKAVEFPVKPNEILNPELKNYLLNSHPKLEVQYSKIEELASNLSIEISFRDSSGNYWKRQSNGKLKRKYIRDLVNYFS
jgi:hypothetical protein